jgi:glutathione S-transferase
MQLIGRYDSPFVRRVGISLHLLGLPFKQLPLSVFSQATEVRKISPLGRVPVLVLADGEVLVDSAAILDHLDEIVGSARRLIPAEGPARRRHRDGCGGQGNCDQLRAPAAGVGTIE